jgi:hypothetical protein
VVVGYSTGTKMKQTCACGRANQLYGMLVEHELFRASSMAVLEGRLGRRTKNM